MSTLKDTLKKQPKLETAMQQVAEQLQRAIAKHPVFPCNFQGISIIGEQVGELCTACNDKWHTPEKCAHPKETVQHLKQEAAQVAVTAIRCVAELEDVCRVMQLSAKHNTLLYCDLLERLLASLHHLILGNDCRGCPLHDPSQAPNRCGGDASCCDALSGYITAMLATDRYTQLVKVLDTAQKQNQDPDIRPKTWYKYFPQLANEAQDIEKYKILILKFCGQKMKEMINAAH